MRTKERILAIRVLEKIMKHPDLAVSLGIKGDCGVCRSEKESKKPIK